MHRHRVWSVFIAVVVSMLGISCAPSAPPAEKQSPRTADQAPAAAKEGQLGAQQPAAQPAAKTSAEAPKSGGRVVVQIVEDPFDWDVSDRGKSGPNNAGIGLAYNSLLGYKAGPGVPYEAAELQPELAERWEVSADGTTFTFHLRKGVKFANLPPVNGREMTSADVKWSFEYWSRTGQFADKNLPKAQYDWMFEDLDAIDTPDPSTVVVRFKQPFAPFLSYAGSNYIPVAPHEIYDQDGHLHDRILGTGPFQLDMDASQKGTRWVWKKNPDYWEPGKPYLDEVVWVVIRDDAAAMAAFQSKQIDWFGDNVPVNVAENVTRANPQATVFEYRQPQPIHLYINTRKPPLDDVRVRKAISLAIDHDEFIKTFTGGRGGLALAGAFPDTFTQEEIRQILPYDPNEARRLLAEAGHSNGVEFEYMFAAAQFGQQHIQEMELLQSQLKKVGINLQPKGFEYADLSNRRRRGDFFMNHTAKAIEADVDSYLFTYHPSNRSNYAGSDDPKLNPLLEAQRREPDPAKRREIVRQAVRYINEEMVYGLTLYAPVDYEFVQPYVKGFAPNFLNPGWNFTNTWVDK
jgi:peptide/nickel transport system substrate-binding protein